uniref:Uncharacterized protein n=1 Tax=Arion vulgaris TaxID=1028688 RepID=A0A0B6YHN4_9EUPU
MYNNIIDSCLQDEFWDKRHNNNNTPAAGISSPVNNKVKYVKYIIKPSLSH